jgi:hypothetical protein
VIKKEAEKILKYKGLIKERHTVHVERKNKSDDNNNTSNWNHLKTIHKIPEQHTRKTQNQDVEKSATLGTAHICPKP